MKICVVGLGYIGLPTAVVLANSGHNVQGFDINKRYVKDLQSGKHSLVEKGFDEALHLAISSGMLSFHDTIQPADTFIVAVSTNLNKKTKKIDLSYLKSAVKAIKSVLKDGNLVIIESTVTPGTTLNLVNPILDTSDTLYHLAFCPERVLPGNLMEEMVRNDRIIGGIDQASTDKAKAVYASFCKGKLHETDPLTAEMAKLMENTYRAVNIALANELALISEKAGGDVWRAIALANNHPRVHIHSPGPGVGGYCLTKDPYFLAENTRAPLIRNALLINSLMPAHIVSLARGILGPLKGKKVGILGLAYKGNVSDARESPGAVIHDLLKKSKALVRIHDPFVTQFNGLKPETDLQAILAWADLVILVTEHSEYAKIDPASLKPVLLDTRNLLPRTGRNRLLGA